VIGMEMAERSPRTPRDFGVAFTALLDAAGISVDRLTSTLRNAGSVTVTRSTLFDWKKGAHLPVDSETLLVVVRLCLRDVQRREDLVPAPHDEQGWRTLLAEAKQTRDSRPGPTGPPVGLRAEVDRRAWVLVADFEIYIEHLGGLQAQLDLIPTMMNVITGVIAKRQTGQFLAQAGLGDSRAPGLDEVGGLNEVLVNLLTFAWQRGYLLARFHRFDRIPRPTQPVDPRAVMSVIIAEGDPEHPDRSLTDNIEIVLQRAVSLLTQPEPVTRTLRLVGYDLADLIQPYFDSWCDTVRGAFGSGILAAKAELKITDG
jgi:hypothetical protein